MEIKNDLRNILEHAVRHGVLMVGHQEAQRRLSICRTCPAFDPRYERCTVCGCYMTVKTLFAAAVCPNGLWTIIKKKETICAQ